MTKIRNLIDDLWLAVFTIFVISVIAIPEGLWGFWEQLGEPHKLDVLLPTLSTLLAACAAVCLTKKRFSRRRRFTRRSHIAWRPPVNKTAWITALASGLALALPSWITRSPLIFNNHLMIRLSCVGLAAPVVEEITFRGVLYRLLACRLRHQQKIWRYTHIILTILISAMLFAWLHSSNFDFQQFGLVPFVMLGLLCGFIRYRYRSSALSATTHAVYNIAIHIPALSGGLMYLIASFTK